MYYILVFAVWLTSIWEPSNTDLQFKTPARWLKSSLDRAKYDQKRHFENLIFNIQRWCSNAWGGAVGPFKGLAQPMWAGWLLPACLPACLLAWVFQVLPLPTATRFCHSSQPTPDIKAPETGNPLPAGITHQTQKRTKVYSFAFFFFLQQLWELSPCLRL